MFQKPADKVVFADDKLEKEFDLLHANGWLKNSIQKAILALKQNAFCGQRISKYLIPLEYIKKYDIDNLWWYPLPNALRLVYSTMTPTKFQLLAVIIEYFDHKNYARRFGYKN